MNACPRYADLYKNCTQYYVAKLVLWCRSLKNENVWNVYSAWNGYSLGYSARNGYSRARTDLGVGGTWPAHVWERWVWERWMWDCERGIFIRGNMISSLKNDLYYMCISILSDFGLSYCLWKCGRTCMGWKLRKGCFGVSIALQQCEKNCRWIWCWFLLWWCLQHSLRVKRIHEGHSSAWENVCGDEKVDSP